MKLFHVSALVALSLFTAGCNSGCAPIQAAVSGKPLAGGTAIDEKAMGAVDALGISTNHLLTAAAKSGKLSRAQLLQAQEIRRNMDLAHDAALAAYKAGDAATFSDKMGAVNELARRATALYDGVTQ